MNTVIYLTKYFLSSFLTKIFLLSFEVVKKWQKLPFMRCLRRVGKHGLVDLMIILVKSGRYPTNDCSHGAHPIDGCDLLAAAVIDIAYEECRQINSR
jgi:hypothetical protein